MTSAPVACPRSSREQPPDARATAVHLEPATWHVIHTKARQERALGRALNAAGIENYLPLISRVSYSGGRRRIVESPLFSSYLFLHGPREAAFFAISTRRVAGVITVPDQARFVHELAQIRSALENGATLDAYAFLHVGRRARVTSGPWRGIEGLIEDKPRPDRLILQVQALGRATSLEIDASLLEPID